MSNACRVSRDPIKMLTRNTLRSRERDQNPVEFSFLVLSLYISVSAPTSTCPTTTFTPQKKKINLNFCSYSMAGFFLPQNLTFHLEMVCGCIMHACITSTAHPSNLSVVDQGKSCENLPHDDKCKSK